MSDLGTVQGIFRYPVKSMLGEELETSPVGRDGLPGDRAWGVRDEQRGDFFVGKRCAALMSCRAGYAPGDEAEGIPYIELPDGQSFRADEDDAAARVGQVVGREVSLWPAGAEARQAVPQDGLTLADEMQQLLAREDTEPMPDFSDPPPELLEIYARGGPFFDAFPLLLLTRRSIDSIAAAAPGAVLDPRRFRPNLLIDSPADSAFPEQKWIGRRIRIGDALVSIHSGCIRCVMTTHAFADLPKDPTIMRALVKQAEGILGVYAIVEEAGEIQRGDRLTVLEA